MCTDYRHAAGFTLAELLLLIVVLGVGLAGILLVINTTTRHSADPMVRKQAMAIAESMMEEVSLMPFAQDGWTGAATPTNRASFDDARDYNGFGTSGIYRIEDGSLVPGLENYNVNVAVVTAAVGGVADALAITVTVTGPIDTTYVLTGHKLDY